MHDFIRSISTRLSNQGLSPRAIGIFTQAMAAGHYRWGRRAKLTAGASIAIALRESHKPDFLRDIAYLIDESFNSVSRAFTSVIALLRLHVPSSDPALQLPTLQTHLHSLINPTTLPPLLPSPLLKQISPLSLPSVMHTAHSLCALVARLTSTLSHLSTSPTSCAILILSLEAEARTSLSNCGELCQQLAARFGLAKGIVMARYKMVYDLVEECIREVPWLEQFETKEGRSKVAKRIVVARGIKDVLQFQEEIWRKKVEAQGRLNVELEEDGDDMSDDGTLSTTTESSSSRMKRGSQGFDEPSGHTRKRRKIKYHDLDNASQFLLNPLNSTLPAITHPSRPYDLRSQTVPTTSLSPSSTTPPPESLTSYLLTASPNSLSLSRIPTRLQLLAAQREGGAEDVRDDELFAEGELDGFLRSEVEVEGLREMLGWVEGITPSEELDISKKGLKSTTKRLGTRRVDMDALAKVLQSDLGKDDDDMHLPDFDINNSAGLEEIEEWRPPSPGGKDAFEYQYDEEC
jgi:transcription factor IIIB 90 kDa subunit